MFNMTAFLAYIFITAYTPGPNNIMSMSHASRMGLKKSYPFNLGILAGFSIVMTVCTLFSSLLFAFIPTIQPYMLAIGTGYMLWMAWKTIKSAPGLNESDSAASTFLTGMLMQFVNAKIFIYCITAMSSYILPFYDDFFIIAGFVAILCLVGFSGSLCWALFGALFKTVFSRYGKAVNTVMALLLVYCAISLYL